MLFHKRSSIGRLHSPLEIYFIFTNQPGFKFFAKATYSLLEPSLTVQIVLKTLILVTFANAQIPLF